MLVCHQIPRGGSAFFTTCDCGSGPWHLINDKRQQVGGNLLLSEAVL